MSDRNCKDCKYNKVVNGEEGCSRWQCEYEPKDMENRVMTIEEAIAITRGAQRYLTAGDPIWHKARVEEGLNMAIQALQEQDQDGCDGCKYVSKDQYEMPCLICCKSYQNMYQRG